MSKPGRGSDAVHMFLSELTARIVAESGKPSDRFHLGKIFLRSFRDDPEFVFQTDGATGETENFRSILERSVRCANCFKNLGLGVGDVIILMAPNHMDTCVPFYAASYLGIIVSAIDRTLNVAELQATFQVSRPKMIFCQRDRAQDVQLSLNELGLDARIVSFDGGDYLCSFQQLMQKHGSGASADEFEPTDFDPDDTIGYLIATSGTTGLPKLAAATVKNFAVNAPYTWIRYTQFPGPMRLAFVVAPLQWLTALLAFIAGPIFRFPRLQSSKPLTKEHFYYLLNNYKPSWFVISPTLMMTMIKADDRAECDFSCVDTILLGGSAVSPDLIEEIREVSPTTEAFNAFGMSELTGVGFVNSNHKLAWACGQPIGCLQYRIIDCETGKDITEPNVPGELWLKGPGVFKEYYRNEEATAETFAEDRWLKTGDMFYVDEYDNFFYVERIKLLLKYMSNQISPFELEDVIRRHPGVLDAAVTGIPDPACGDLPVACVVRKQGSSVTAEEIKQLVRESLSDSKQLRGGVIFVDAIPQTASTKVHRRHLKEIAMGWERE